MTANLLTLFCLVDGDSMPFSVDIDASKTVDRLKDAIKTKKAPRFDDVAAAELTLWRVSVAITDDDDDETPILLEKKKLRTTSKLFMVFGADLPEDTIHVIVQRPLPAAKRDREDDAGPSSESKRCRPYTLMDAIEEAGLTEKAVVDGKSDLSCLDNKQRVMLLDFLGEGIDRSDTFDSLSSTALELKGANTKDIDRLSAPPGTRLPVVGTNDLYVREAYKDLYDTILGTFENNRPCTGNEAEKHIVVTGTSGIGKSAFLVYFAIRLLAESDDDNPPIIIFHTKRTARCYVFGGRSTVRSGNIEAFKPFLNLPDTWYFVDCSLDPVLGRAKTVISASPETLFSEDRQYKDIDKEVVWRYYMTPWNLEELEKCRSSVVGFKVVPSEVVEELYSKIGGVPRYVLKWPMMELDLLLNDFEGAKVMACERLEQALDRVKDPVMLMQFFSQARYTFGFSSRLIHRWPTDDHRAFRWEWASTYVVEKVAALLSQDTCIQMLKMLVMDPDESVSGIMFEAYVLRTFREGGHIFELKDLETGQSTRLEILRNPKLAPSDLIQIMVSKNHPIKGPPLVKLIGGLIQARWTTPLDEPRLIFVVPSHVYDDFEKQDYLTVEGKVYRTVPADIQRVKQYVLKIDLESAASGKAPGLQGYGATDATTTR